MPYLRGGDGPVLRGADRTIRHAVAACQTEKEDTEMALERFKATVSGLLDEIQRHPENKAMLQEQLRRTLAEYEALGLPLPENYVRLSQRLEDEDADDFFDNVPV